MLDYVINAFTFLSSDIASITITSLALIELLSYLFFSDSLSIAKKQLFDIIKFKSPLNTLSLLSWIVLFVFSLIYSHTASPISFTLLILGLSLFFIGWLIRYPPHTIDRLSRKHRFLKRFLPSYFGLWNKLKLYSNNQFLYGYWLEIIGITIIAKSLIIYIPALIIFPIILGAAVIHKNKKLAVLYPQTDYPSVNDLIPNVRNILSIVLIPLVASVIVGLITREFTIFYGNTETAELILVTLSQIEGSVGILAITIIFVLTQLTASNYSIRISTILFRQSIFWIPLLILFASITYNLTIASRSPIIFPSATDNFGSLIIDLSFVLGLATASSIAYFIFRAPRLISPESIITDSLKSVDKVWLKKVKRDWCHPAFKISLNVSYDPFIIIERILSKAVVSGDNLTFLSGLVLIRDHLQYAKTIEPHKLPDYIIEIDAYLRHHFAVLCVLPLVILMPTLSFN